MAQPAQPPPCAHAVYTHTLGGGHSAECAISQGARHPLRMPGGTGATRAPCVPRREKPAAGNKAQFCVARRRPSSCPPLSRLEPPRGHVLLFLLRSLFVLRVAAGWFMASEERNGEGAWAAHSPSCECWSASGGRWAEAPGGARRAGLIPAVPLPSCLRGLASSTGSALHKAKVASAF